MAMASGSKMDYRIPYPLISPSPHQRAGVVTHSPTQAQPPSSPSRSDSIIQLPDVDVEAVPIANYTQPEYARFNEIDCLLLLLKARITLDSGPFSTEKYDRTRTIARQALQLARSHNDLNYAARSYYYLAETIVIYAETSPPHLNKARELYNRTLECEDGLPEVDRAKMRLQELDHIFPDTAVSAISSLAPGSAVSIKSPLGTQEDKPASTADSLAMRADALVKRRGYEVMPDFDDDDEQSPLSGVEAEPQGKRSSVSKDRTSVTTSESALQRASTEGLGEEPVLSPVLRVNKHVDHERRQRKNRVSFSSALDDDDKEPSLNNLSHRRRLSRTLTLLPRRRSEIAQMEEGRSPVSPDFNDL